MTTIENLAGIPSAKELTLLANELFLDLVGDTAASTTAVPSAPTTLDTPDAVTNAAGGSEVVSSIPQGDNVSIPLLTVEYLLSLG